MQSLGTGADVCAEAIMSAAAKRAGEVSRAGRESSLSSDADALLSAAVGSLSPTKASAPVSTWLRWYIDTPLTTHTLRPQLTQGHRGQSRAKPQLRCRRSSKHQGWPGLRKSLRAPSDSETQISRPSTLILGIAHNMPCASLNYLGASSRRSPIPPFILPSP